MELNSSPPIFICSALIVESFALLLAAATQSFLEEDWMENLSALVDQAQAAVNAATEEQVLEQLRVDYLGKKGQLTGQKRAPKSMLPSSRSTTVFQHERRP